MFFCKCVIYVGILLLIIHTTNIFGIAEYLTQKQSWFYLSIQPSNIVLVGRPIGNVTLLSTFLAVQYL